MTTADHHSAYLARALAALEPEGRERANALLAQLAQAAGGRGALLRFAAERKAEVELGSLDGSAQRSDPPLTEPELDALTTGFITIRDQEPRDDVADWANAVLALLRDEDPRSGLR